MLTNSPVPTERDIPFSTGTLSGYRAISERNVLQSQLIDDTSFVHA